LLTRVACAILGVEARATTQHRPLGRNRDRESGSRSPIGKDPRSAWGATAGKYRHMGSE